MSKGIYIIFLSFAPAVLFGQAVSKGGRFSVDFAKGCSPLAVHVTKLDTFGNVTRQYFYEQGAIETTAASHTYRSPGIYHIVQVVGIDVTPKTDTLTIEVLESSNTRFTVEKCDLNGISITSADETYDFIRVYFTTEDSASLAFGEGTSFNYPSVSNQSFQTKGFYTNGKENCTVSSHNISPLSALTTPEILSSSVKETCQDNFVLTLDSRGYDPLINYQIEFEQVATSVIYEGKIDSNFVFISGIPYSKTNSHYCVKINAIDRCTNDLREGQSFCQTISRLSSTPFEYLYSGYAGNSILINLSSVYSGSLLVYRKFEENGTFKLRNTVQHAFSDPIGSLSRTYFYRVDYLDSCNQVLFSAETNPPFLSSTTLSENSYFITYTPPVNLLSSSIVSKNYEVGNETVDLQPLITENFELRLHPANGTRQLLHANVTYDNGISIASNGLTFKHVSFVYVPTAFTPNNDGLNDTLEVFGLPTETATTNIYTRWGQLIYTSIEPTPGWNGLVSGGLAPEGVYLYEVIFQDLDGEKVIQKGTFALVKK